MKVSAQNEFVSVYKVLKDHLQQENLKATSTGPIKIHLDNFPWLGREEATPLMLHGWSLNGMPDSTWIFDVGKYQVSDSVVFKDSYLKVYLDGTAKQIDGRFESGSFDGKWTVSVDRIMFSEFQENLFKSEFTFKAGYPQQSFQIKNDAMVLLGRFNRKGLAHDSWSVFTEGLETENWIFQDGRLEEIRIVSEGEEKVVKIFSDNIIALDTLEVGNLYLDIISAYYYVNHPDSHPKDLQVSGLLSSHIAHYNDLFSSLKLITDTFYKPYFLATIPVIPFTEEEENYLNKLNSRLTEVQYKITLAQENAGLKLLRTADEEVAYSLSALEEVNAKLVDPLNYLSELDKSGALKAIPRNLLMDKISAEISVDSLLVTYAYKQETLKRVLPLSVSNGSTDKKDLLFSLEKISEVVDYLTDQLSARMKLDRRQASLDTVEKVILKLSKSLDSLISTESSEIRENYGLLDIQRAADQAISEYSTTADSPEKPQQAQNLHQCLRHYYTLVETAIIQKVRTEEIEKLYTDEVWNNFTQTIMTEKLKTRITNAYFEVILPALREQIRNKLTCDSVERINQLINEAYWTMIELRSKDSSRIESDLKGKEDPREVLEILGLNSIL